MRRPEEAPIINRRQIEELFGVSPRTAQHLLARFGGDRLGKCAGDRAGTTDCGSRETPGDCEVERQVLRHEKVKGGQAPGRPAVVAHHPPGTGQ